MGMAGCRVGILAEDHDPHAVERREAKCVEDVIRRRQELLACPARRIRERDRLGGGRHQPRLPRPARGARIAQEALERLPIGRGLPAHRAVMRPCVRRSTAPSRFK